MFQQNQSLYYQSMLCVCHSGQHTTNDDSNYDSEQHTTDNNHRFLLYLEEFKKKNMGKTVQAAWKVEKKSYCNDPGRNVIAYLKIRGEQFEDDMLSMNLQIMGHATTFMLM